MDTRKNKPVRCLELKISWLMEVSSSPWSGTSIMKEKMTAMLSLLLIREKEEEYLASTFWGLTLDK